MKLKDLYNIVIQKAINDDQRNLNIIKKILNDSKKDYENLTSFNKKFFDLDNLIHPYYDTRILNGSKDLNIKNVMVGIDITEAELLLVDRLRKKNIDIDLVISHHPIANASTQLYKVMNMYVGLWQEYGIKQNISENIIKERKAQVRRSISSSNYAKILDIARLLDIPFMCMHTVADNCVVNFLKNLFAKNKPKKLKNILNILEKIPEYKIAMQFNAGPFILNGDKNKDAGNIFVDMTGGVSAPDKIYSRLSSRGVNTIVGMFCKEKTYATIKSEFLNYVVAGHMSSDSLGMNLLFDHIEKKEQLNFIECSSFKRIRRK